MPDDSPLTIIASPKGKGYPPNQASVRCRCGWQSVWIFPEEAQRVMEAVEAEGQHADH